MQNGGKKWSGSRSDSILFQFSFSFRERWNANVTRVEKAEEWEQYNLLSHRRQNEEDDKEDDKEEVDTTAKVPWAECERKKGGIVVFPWTLFRLPKTLTRNITKKPKISSLERTERDQKHERERKSFFLRFFMHCFLPMFVVFTYTLFYTRAYACATF